MIDSSFEHEWQAEVLAARPMILPARQFVYPARVEEVEVGALEVFVRPPKSANGAPPQAPFLATCALGFADPLAPTGVWACPDPAWLCAVAGGYAYLMDTRDPAHWEQVEYRPVTKVCPVPQHGLLIFAGFNALTAWGREGKRWETHRLSWEGLRISGIQGDTLAGYGWEMMTDRELEFEVDLKTGAHRGGGYLPAK